MERTQTVFLEEAYRAHRPAVESLARRLCGPDLASDVAQDVFLRLAQRPEAYDPTRGTLRSYLLTVGHHVAVDHLRAEQARRQRQHRYLAGSPGTEPDVAIDVAERNEGATMLRLVERLSVDERDAVLAAFRTAGTYRDVAVAFGAAEGTIKSRIRRGLQRLRTMAAQEALSTSAA